MDPTLVRIIAVALLIIGWGVPAIVYVVMLMVVPPDPGLAQGYVDARAEATAPGSYQSNSLADDTLLNQPPPPSAGTRVTATSFEGSEKSTVQTPMAPMDNPGPGFMPDPAKGHHAGSAKARSSFILTIGAVLVGVGTIALLSNFVHMSLWRFWPVVLIVVGIVCLFTPGYKGWSLERAGNSIVLISIGLVLLAWMLEIIGWRVFVAVFIDLWPVMLVVIGIDIIGVARKSSVLALAGSLLFSATVIIGIWVYGGLDWASLISTPIFSESDGFHEFIRDISRGL